MKDVLGIEHLGYGELRPEEGGPGGPDWHPIEVADGRFGTTDETHIITRKRRATARLVDVETGELVATARKSCPLERAANSGAQG